MPLPRVPRSLREIVDPQQSVLVVWDMQRGIGGRAHEAGRIVAKVNELLKAARATGVLIIWSRHVAPPLDLTSPSGLRSLMKRQGLSDPAQLTASMQAGTADIEIVAGLCPLAGELVIEKTTPSFFVGTPLELRLRSRGIQTLVLTGVATEQGIEMTARHALTLGFFTVVIEDAVGSFSTAAHELGLAYLRTAVDVVPASEIVEAWGRRLVTLGQ